MVGYVTFGLTCWQWFLRPNSGISSFLLPSAQFLLSFCRAYLYYVYGALVPFLCTSTYRTGDMVYTYGWYSTVFTNVMDIMVEFLSQYVIQIRCVILT